MNVPRRESVLRQLRAALTPMARLKPVLACHAGCLFVQFFDEQVIAQSV